MPGFVPVVMAPAPAAFCDVRYDSWPDLDVQFAVHSAVDLVLSAEGRTALSWGRRRRGLRMGLESQTGELSVD